MKLPFKIDLGNKVAVVTGIEIADGKIVTYVNGTFYPVNVADITPATTTTAREVYNPLCNCCSPC